MLKSKHIIALLLITALFSCHSIGSSTPFTTEQWLLGDGLQYTMRDDLLDDLVKHHKLKGLTYKEVHHLLGYPDWSDSTQHKFYYQIIETRNNMRKLNHVKNLVFYLDKDSIVTRFEVYDYHLKDKKN